MEKTVLPTGDVLIGERTGALKCYSPNGGEVKVGKQFEVSLKNGGRSRKIGLLDRSAGCHCGPSPHDDRLVLSLYL